MGRVLYIVTREQPLLCGYLMTTVGARSPGGHRVEIKLDERRGERRLQGEARDPERRRGERRRQPNYDSALRSRGYVAVVQSEATPSRSEESAWEPIMVWRPRSTWWQRATRTRRRGRARWARRGLIALLLVVLGASIVVGRSIYHTLDLPRRIVGSNRPEPTRPSETARPLPLAPPSKAETVSPDVRPMPPSSPPPVRVVTTRSSGIVLSVNPRARTLVLQDLGAAAEGWRRRVELAPDARVVLSERDDRAEDFSHPFKDTAISLSDVRAGDFVVVETRGPEGKALARSVVVTFRGSQGSGRAAQP
jgi:hypothetical protein